MVSDAWGVGCPSSKGHDWLQMRLGGRWMDGGREGVMVEAT